MFNALLTHEPTAFAELEIESEPDFAAQIEQAYADREAQDNPMWAVSPCGAELDFDWEALLDLMLISMMGLGRRRPSPKEHSMIRDGRRYAVRKDHGTKIRRTQIEAENARRDSRVSGSVRDMRRWRKREARCDAATLAKLSRIS